MSGNDPVSIDGCVPRRSLADCVGYEPKETGTEGIVLVGHDVPDRNRATENSDRGSEEREEER
jgi:hypothetical protein